MSFIAGLFATKSLDELRRQATAEHGLKRALTALDLMVLPGSDFSALADGLVQFRSSFEQTARIRAKSDEERAASSPED